MSEELLFDLCCLMLIFILTCLNISICVIGKKPTWFINVLFIVYIPLFVLDIISYITYDFTKTIVYLMFFINMYLDMIKLKYLYTNDSKEVRDFE